MSHLLDYFVTGLFGILVFQNKKLISLIGNLIDMIKD